MLFNETFIITSIQYSTILFNEINYSIMHTLHISFWRSTGISFIGITCYLQIKQLFTIDQTWYSRIGELLRSCDILIRPNVLIPVHSFIFTIHEHFLLPRLLLPYIFPCTINHINVCLKISSFAICSAHEIFSCLQESHISNMSK